MLNLFLFSWRTAILFASWRRSTHLNVDCAACIVLHSACVRRAHMMITHEYSLSPGLNLVTMAHTLAASCSADADTRVCALDSRIDSSKILWKLIECYRSAFKSKLANFVRLLIYKIMNVIGIDKEYFEHALIAN